jgi:hypothetical protein
MALRSFCAAALVGLGVVACGAGDTAGTVVVADNSLPTNSDQPATNPNQPATNPNQPASSSATPSSACAAFCQTLVGCFGSAVNASELGSECQGACAREFEQSTACQAELIAFVTCAARGNLVCELDDDDLDFEAPNCQAEEDALDACEDGGNSGPGNSCTAPTCACDGDPCDICRCSLGNNAEACDSLC